jgi:hypothetical protein
MPEADLVCVACSSYHKPFGISFNEDEKTTMMFRPLGSFKAVLALTMVLAFTAAAHAADKVVEKAQKQTGARTQGAQTQVDQTQVGQTQVGQTQVEQAQVDRLTSLAVETIPLGEVLDLLAKADPKWPMQEKKNAVDAKQLACLRDELSPQGYRRYKRTDVLDYVARRGSHVETEIKILESGAAMLMGKLVMAGANARHSGQEISEESILGQATPEQVASFMSLMVDPKYGELRELVGLGNGLKVNNSSEENKEIGEQIGGNLALQLVLRAMGSCEVPMSALFAK